MLHDRIVQGIAAILVIVGLAGGGMLLPRVLEISEENSMRFTNTSVEGAPAIVALGNSIGALRGLIVDYLWLKVHIAKQKGLFYEVMADSDLITKLQPRFAGVWAFHGHNMAYNISVMTHTQAERWEWVQAGINLVRNEGLRYNPNDLLLHKELAFWFGHKIEGVNDDAHLYYKREFCRQWHGLLGEPPYAYDARTAWIKTVADAPETMAEAEARTPGVLALVQNLRAQFEAYRIPVDDELGETFLRSYTYWQGVTKQSIYSKLLGRDREMRARSPYFVAFDALASDPELQAQWDTLIALVRKRVLRDNYNMDPQFMYELTRDYGPLDWRHGGAHQFYWSMKGQAYEARIPSDDVSLVLNNARLQIQAMQLMARSGDIRFDPESSDRPSRLPDIRWIDPTDRYFEKLYVKYDYVRGMGGDTFIDFHINFMSDQIRFLARRGYREEAEKRLAKLNDLYGTGGLIPNYEYMRDLDSFVRKEVFGEYEYQPHLAPNDVVAALAYGIQAGIGRNNQKVWEDAQLFAKNVKDYFRNNRYNDYVTKFGEGRIADIMDDMDIALFTAFEQVLTDQNIPLVERIAIYQVTPRDVQGYIYDRVQPALMRDIMSGELARLNPAQLVPEPPTLDEMRVKRAEREARRAARNAERVPEIQRR